MASSIDPFHKVPLELIQTHLSVILRLVNSNEKINKLKLEDLCKETYEFILIKFPWVSKTPSLHKLLAHSFQIIHSYNNGIDLRNISEECLEACNKYVRRFRENLSRKNSFTDNIRDIQTRLICWSDPILAYNRFNHKINLSHSANLSQDTLYETLIYSV